VANNAKTFSFELHGVTRDLVDEVSRLVNQLTGNQIGEKQASMVQARMSRRLIELKMSSEQYLDYLRKNQATESKVLISLLTTHHTYFFREFSHFEYLGSRGLAELTAKLRAEGRKTIRVWSAACSFGQEVYTLSMALKYHLKEVAPDFTYEILGTDIDPESVALAQNGVFRWEEVKEIPANYFGDHWVRGTEEIAEFVKAKKSIKDPCRFETANLLKLDQSVNSKFDIIFCRNVLIYFNQDQVQTIIKQLLQRLDPNGLLFLGISESIMGTTLPITYVGPAIYRHKGAEVSSPSIPRPAPGATVARAAAPAPIAKAEAPIRVLCVDDSPVILNLLKKIFQSDPSFEVVGTAKNGIEATERMKAGGVDVMTLDIHMPDQTGVEYLEKSFRPGHVPVVMVTSVSRDDSALGVRCLQLGAVDFVEKPALADFEKRGEELRMKLRCAFRASRSGSNLGLLKLTQSFSKPQVIRNPESKARVVVCNLADRAKLNAFLRLAKMSPTALKDAPPLVILVQGGENVLSGLTTELSGAAGTQVELLGDKLAQGGIYLGEFRMGLTKIKSRGFKRTAVLLIGDITEESGKQLSDWAVGKKEVHLITEDQAGGFSPAHRKLQEKANEAVPVTSFFHSSDFFLAGDT
jgi:chemotaxis protein methyltransferase CheR